MMVALTLAAAAVAGLVLGMLGGGGSILTLPILVYLAGMPTREAIAASLVVVAATSTVALIPHAHARRVQWRTAIGFSASGVLAAYAGGRIAEKIPATILLTGFALMMATAAVAMLRPRRSAPTPRDGHRASMARTAPLGGLVGLVTGLIGAGGGFVIVPVLALLAGLTMADAIGTSLFAIAIQSTAGLLGHLHHVHVDWALTVAVTAAAITGSLLGARLAGRLRHTTLRTAFGWLVVAMASLILLQQTPTALRQWLVASPGGWATLAATAAAVVATVAWTRARQSPDHTPPPDSRVWQRIAAVVDKAFRRPTPYLTGGSRPPRTVVLRRRGLRSNDPGSAATVGGEDASPDITLIPYRGLGMT